MSLPSIDDTLIREINAAAKSSELYIQKAGQSCSTPSKNLIMSALEPLLALGETIARSVAQSGERSTAALS